MSSFTWLDYSERDRQRMLDVVSLFKDKVTRDEIGIGTIRDAFSDLLFPGTSTIQTRARYFLFIPWIYLRLESRHTSPEDFSQKARSQEVALIHALFRSGETEGLIGRRSKGSLKRLPSAIYWQGLGRWGIRAFPGDQWQYQQKLRQFYAVQIRTAQRNKEEGLLDPIPRNWHAGLPDIPQSFPDEIAFQLPLEEAQYLQERVKTSAPRSMLAWLMDQAQPIDFQEKTNFPWEFNRYAQLPHHIKEQLTHAQNFSLVFHGAALLYNLILAEEGVVNSLPWKDLVKEYRDALEEWAEIMQTHSISLSRWHWQGEQSRFWQIVSTENQNIPFQTKNFVNKWINLALPLENAITISDNQEARELIRHREFRLKGGLARLHNSRALELWNGEAGIGQLNYRWHITQTLVSDILQGLYPEAETRENNA